MDQLLPAIDCISYDRPHLIGVHLVGGHQVDQDICVLSPLVDPIPVFHAVEIAHLGGRPS